VIATASEGPRLALVHTPIFATSAVAAVVGGFDDKH
jgi:hypothetical protein